MRRSSGITDFRLNNGFFSVTRLIMLEEVMPFSQMRRGFTPPHLHVMLSVKAMLCAAEKGASAFSAEDVARCLNNFVDKPDAALTDTVKSNVRTAAEAAGLVFMHSAYENAVFDLVKCLVRYDPKPWLQFIGKKSVQFGQLQGSDISQIQEGLLKDWLEQAEKESFPWKVGKVLAVLQPQTTKDALPGFEFNMEKFKEIDDLRHKLTHEPNFATPIQDIHDKLSYLHRTVLMLEKLAEQKYPGPRGQQR